MSRHSREKRERPANPVPAAAAPWGAIALLIVLVLAVYWRTAGYPYVNYDDDLFVYNNEHVKAGLTFDSINWALSSNFINWQPLVWLSFMATVSAFGPSAGPHHMLNVLLHVANAVLLFLLFRRWTKSHWPSFFAAALFALHPLRVQSVAWVTERKDVLSGLFWLLTLWAYTWYAEKPSDRRRLYWTLGAYMAGLMAKPMLVTMPLVMLLLDGWPLRRRAEFTWATLVREKITFAVLAGVSGVITLFGQSAYGAVQVGGSTPLALRVQNSLLSYLLYLRDTVWPVELAVFYPYANPMPMVLVLAGGLLVAGVSWFCRRRIEEWPWLATGWFSYLITLLPVVGIIQVGAQSRADRYTYIPCMVLMLAVVLLCQRVPVPRGALAAAGVVAVAALAGRTVVEVGYWQDSRSLYERAIEVTGGSKQVHNNLGNTFLQAKDYGSAMRHFAAALGSDPNAADTLGNVGLLLMLQGKADEAVRYYERALPGMQNSVKVQFQAGQAYMMIGETEKAVEHFRNALALGIPADSLAAFHLDLGTAEYALKHDAAALASFNEVIRLQPQYAPAYKNAAIALGNMGRMAEAVARFAEYLALNPSDDEARAAMEALKKAGAGGADRK